MALSLGLILSACGTDGTADGEAANEATAGDTPDGDATDNAGPTDDVAIGTHPTGTSYNTVGTALASLLSSHTDLNAAVQPQAGPNAYISDMVSGALAFGIPSSIDAAWAYGGGPGFDDPIEETRLVVNGGPIRIVGMVVLEGSDIETVADVEGMRMTTGFGGNQIANEVMNAMLASVGLDESDIEPVPVPDVTGALDALRAGQVDVAFGLVPVAPDIVDLDTAVGLRSLSFGDLDAGELPNSEGEEVLAEYLPGSQVTVLEEGFGILENDVVGIAYDLQLITMEGMSDDVITTVLSTLWENYEEMHDAHPAAKWTPENMLITNFQVPYHDAAVGHFESIGEWTDEHQAQQDQLLGG